MKTAELLSGIDGTMMFRYNSKDTFQALYVYLSEYHSGKRVSHKRVLELSYEDVKSAKNATTQTASQLPFSASFMA